MNCSYILLTGFSSDSSGREPTCQKEDIKDMGLIPGSERSLGGGHGNPF